MSKNRIAATVAALSLASVASLAMAPVAQADASCTITNYTPHTVVMGLSPVAVDFNVTTSGCTQTGWDVDITGSSPSSSLWAYAWDGNPTEVIEPYYDMENVDAGYRFDVVTTADNDDWDTTTRVFTDSFAVKRRTTFTSFNASPEPVRKYKPITVTGRLKVADWNANAYVAQKYSSVAVQFKRSGTNTWKTIKTVKTSSTGNVSTTATAGYDGTWRLSYPGSGTRGPAVSGGDYVDVR